jgi:hypothetical protein
VLLQICGPVGAYFLPPPIQNAFSVSLKPQPALQNGGGYGKLGGCQRCSLGESQHSISASFSGPQHKLVSTIGQELAPPPACHLLLDD